MKKLGRPPVPVKERFWSKVDKTPGHGPGGDCWMWTAAKDHGYGCVGYGKGSLRAHRVSYWMANPKWDLRSKEQVNHSCDVPACVNPKHLHLGTALSNAREMVDRGRHRQGVYPRPDLTSEETDLKIKMLSDVNADLME